MAFVQGQAMNKGSSAQSVSRVKVWNYIQIMCPFGPESKAAGSQNAICKKGLTVCLETKEGTAEEILHDTRFRLAQHINATHDYGWESAEQLAAEQVVNEWREETVEKQTAPATQAQTQSSATTTRCPPAGMQWIRVAATEELHDTLCKIQRELHRRGARSSGGEAFRARSRSR